MCPRASSFALGLVVSAALAGCGDPEAPAEGERVDPWFEDVTAASGLDFVPERSGLSPELLFLPEIMWGGVALVDVDADGDLDAFLLDPAETGGTFGRLFLQTAPMRFEDGSEGRVPFHQGVGFGVAAGDFDADGYVDLYVTQIGRDVLLRNEGGARFVDGGASVAAEEEGWSASAAFCDLDGDGDLDLFVTRYLAYEGSHVCRDGAGRVEYCGPTDFAPLHDLLLLNEGGTFRDASVELGLANDPRRGLGVVCADLSGDGVVDVFVANDNDPNQLWVRQADGRYRDEAPERGLAYSADGDEEAGMGVACGDVDRDGDLDVVLSHLSGETSTVYLQGPAGLFRDASDDSGVGAPTLGVTGFGIVLADFDDDGLPDVVQANGRVTRDSSWAAAAAPDDDHLMAYAETPLFLAGAAPGVFVDASGRLGSLARRRTVGRGLAVGDLDQDGGLDLLMTSTASHVVVLRNVASGRGHWLGALPYRGGVVDAGATVVFVTPERSIAALAGGLGSYLSASDPAARVGLGDDTRCDRIEVLWTDGVRERFEVDDAGDLGRVIRVTRGGGAQ